MTNEMIKTEAPQLMKITADDVKKYFDKGNKCSSIEVALFLRICQINNLNPFNREVHLIKYGTSPASIVTGYEVYLKRAEASKQWGGDKCWTEGTISDGSLKACIEIYRKDWDKPLYHEVLFKEYARDTQIWKDKPITMIKKVATAQAYRRAFPTEIGGLPYVSEETGSEVNNTAPDFEMPKERVEEQTTTPSMFREFEKDGKVKLEAQGTFVDSLTKDVKRKDGTISQITRYTITNGAETVVISKFGSAEEVIPNDTVRFYDIAVSEYRGEKQYLAQDVEVISFVDETPKA